MDLHDQIMNIAAPSDFKIAAIVTENGNRNAEYLFAYRCGHRDARHAAAELANAADLRIAELESDLENARRRVAVLTGDLVNRETELESARAGESAALERCARIQVKAKTFLDEIENGEGCQCFETANEVVPTCKYCSASMALNNCIPELDPEDF